MLDDAGFCFGHGKLGSKVIGSVGYIPPEKKTFISIGEITHVLLLTIYLLTSWNIQVDLDYCLFVGMVGCCFEGCYLGGSSQDLDTWLVTMVSKSTNLGLFPFKMAELHAFHGL